MTHFDLFFDATFLCRSAGVLGFLCYIGGFAALQLQMISGEGVLYSLSKIFGAALVLISLSVDFNLSSAMIQVSFLGIGLTGLYLRLRRRWAERDRLRQYQSGIYECDL